MNSKISKKIIFIRHAMSIENEKINSIYNNNENIKQEEILKEINLDKKMIDIELNEKGKIQCKKIQKKINKINFDIVLISPLRRTLETCNLIFEHYKKKNYIKFLLFPFIREKLISSSDLPICSKKLKKWVDQKNFFIDLDFSLIEFIEKNHCCTWLSFTFFGNFKNNINEKIENDIDKLINDNNNEIKKKQKNKNLENKKILKKMKEIYPSVLENYEQVKKRCEETLNWIKDYLTKNQNSENIGVVSHSEFIATFLCKKISDDFLEIYDPYYLENCEIKEFYLEK